MPEIRRKKKFTRHDMPTGLRRKLYAALSLLLIATVLTVSTTYAWFTLSTAPELSGITAAVGANGNLEIALLNAESFVNPTLIKAKVGDSIDAAGQTVPQANITWGNLVDLSDASYHLSDVTLLPSKLTGEDNSEVPLTSVSTGNPLSIPVYGRDGRIASLSSDTATAAYTDGGFRLTTDSQSYGVRAIGSVIRMTERIRGFFLGQSKLTTGRTSAVMPISMAIALNIMVFLTLAEYQQGDILDEESLIAIEEVAAACEESIDSLIDAYRGVIIIRAAVDELTDEGFAAKRDAIAAASDAELANLTGNAEYKNAINELIEAKASVAEAIAQTDKWIEGEPQVYSTVVQTYKKLLNVDEPAASMYITEGAIGTIAKYTGTFQLVNAMGYKVYAGANGEAGVLAPIAESLGAIAPPAGGEEVIQEYISDFYGYIMDLAFRTNASNSNLQLRTRAVNRVYEEDMSAALMGSGSVVTYEYAEDMDEDMAESLLDAVRIIFFNPDSGEIYSRANLATYAISGPNRMTATIVLADDVNNPEQNILPLEKNIPAKVSVLVYLDGEEIENKSVSSAASSGNISINLQFGSSAALDPMDNEDIRGL